MFPNYNFSARELITQREERLWEDVEAFFGQMKGETWEDFLEAWRACQFSKMHYAINKGESLS